MGGRHRVEHRADRRVRGNLVDTEDCGGVVLSEPRLVLPLKGQKGGVLEIENRGRGKQRVPHLVPKGRMIPIARVGERGRKLVEGIDDIAKR